MRKAVFCLIKVKLSFRHLIFLISFIFCIDTYSQSDSVQYNFEINGLASSGDYAPFWLQNNQYGKVSFEPSSLNISAGIFKELNNDKQKFDYAFGANAIIVNDNKNNHIYFHELYAEARFLVFDLTLGAKEEIFGNQDSSLSMGGLLFSKNYRPIPKIYAGIREFCAVPFTKGYFEIKGGISHGWFTDNTYIKNALLHHKYLYLRLGGELPVKIQYGMDHVAQWGGESVKYGMNPSGIKDFLSTFLASSGGNSTDVNEQINAVGNHIISQSIKTEIKAGSYLFDIYWQNISEDAPLRLMWKAMNKADGLWGFSIRNNKLPVFQHFVYEYLNTTDQSGPYHEKDGIVFGGFDNYFNNYWYESGWSNYKRTIGTPLITSTTYGNNLEIDNNRVQAHNLGLGGLYKNYHYKIMITTSKNYGLYLYPYQHMISATSLYGEISKAYDNFNGIEAGLKIGADFGEMYGKNFGCMVSFKKRGILFNY